MKNTGKTRNTAILCVLQVGSFGDPVDRTMKGHLTFAFGGGFLRPLEGIFETLEREF